MALASRSSRRFVSPTLQSMSGVLAVVHARVENRGSLESHAMEMVAARMALALRENPPEAQQLALMQAYQRSRRVR